ncbi:hypothetical protein CCR75_003725 [Bremia lactucae]|uniref:Uncharacterized protein n=1 Tax=Bremia lactucae TaxID=4779 RepID=A0A976NYT2_BRELC|nr:hypothetical protein CCR75_003725 [Bremia lactucae]
MSLNDEKLEPMPPPPAPKAHPMSTLPLPHLYQLHNASIKASTNLDEQLTPLSPPVPHTHPPIALNDESAHNDKLQRGRDGMAISSHQTISNRKTTIGQQGNSTSLSRNRIKACTGQHQETLQSGNPLAYEAEHVSRADAIQMLQHVRFMEKAPVLVPLGDQEKVIAATKASDSRCELVQVARQLVMNERR